MAAIDISGQRFGKLVAERRVPPRGKSRAYRWLCRCDCGTEHEANINNLNTGHTTSCGCAKRAGLTVDETRFRECDTPDEAYWLGFLLTDGCVTDKGVIRLNLSAKDADHVEAFRTFLGATHPIRTQETPSSFGGGPQAIFVVTSRKIADSLGAQGVHPRKTWTGRPWDGPTHLLHHYWRGCLDGDGGICISKQRGKYVVPWVHFCGNEFVTQGFHDFVQDRLGFHGQLRLIQPNGARARAAGHRFGRLSWAGVKRCQAVLRLLGYGGEDVSLARKKATARQVLAMPVGQPGEALSRDDLLAAFQQGGSWSAAARLLSLPCQTVRKRARKLGAHEGDVNQWRSTPWRTGRPRATATPST